MIGITLLQLRPDGSIQWGLDSNGNIHITGYKDTEQLAEIEEHKSDWIDIVAIAAGGGSRNAGKTYETGHTVALKKMAQL